MSITPCHILTYSTFYNIGHEKTELRMEEHYSLQHPGAAAQSGHISTRPYGFTTLPSGSEELFARLQEPRRRRTGSRRRQRETLFLHRL